MESNLFGEYLRKKRKEMDLTLKELSTEIGLTHGYISNVENGKMKGNLDLIEGLQVILQIPITESIIRLKIDKGELHVLENVLDNKDINHTDLLIDMCTNKPGKYYLFTRRLMSLKTLDEISAETGLARNEIINIEEYGPKKVGDINALGKCYGIDDFSYYLLNIIETGTPLDSNILEGIIINNKVPDLYRLKLLWQTHIDKELTSEEIDLTKKYEQDFTIEYIKQNAKNKVTLKSDDIYFRLNKLKRVSFKGKSLSISEKNKAIKLLELIFDMESVDESEI
ncbi:helix-turn-helix domain-containing protein [Gracilibacillus saliphilus]|uniref:helix-turn-helix domain-containing protein n=1 Tax=Gracilibacillus saliphilus TaxID=543890 RepID=UPI0013D42448|nr:helix-turn-helix transcriptional regulator [Gracilibacillus saliphilus]